MSARIKIRNRSKSLSELHRIIKSQKDYHNLLSTLLFDALNEIQKLDKDNDVRICCIDRLKIATDRQK